MKKGKRMLAWLLSACMICAAPVISVQAEEQETVENDDVKFQISEDGWLEEYLGNDSVVVIPEKP